MTEPSTPSAYEELVAAIVKAVPEIRDQPCTHKLMADENGCPFLNHSRPITLEDVLHTAYPNKMFVSTHGALCVWDEKEKALRAFAMWHLGKPLSAQDKDTIDWLVSLFPISK